MTDRKSVDFLSLVDTHFVRLHRGHGVPVAMQGLWMLDDVVDEPTLAELHRGLAVGHLNRRAIRPRIPGGRHYWVRGATIAPLYFTPELLPRPEIIHWADERAQVRLNPEHGIGWELSVARLEDGGTVMSLVCSHALTDAKGLIDAVREAMNSGENNDLPPYTRRLSIWQELGHVWRQYWSLLVGTLVALYTIFVQGSNRDEIVRYLRLNRIDVLRRKRAATLATSGKLDGEWRPPSTIVDVDAEEWDAIAAKSGGSPNSLLIGIAANLLFSSGARTANEAVTIGVPVDLSEIDRMGRPRTNELTIASVTLRPRGTRYGELFLIKEMCREAFDKAVREKYPEETRPASMPTEILDVVPDRIAARLVRTSGLADAIATYVGQVPESMTKLGKFQIESTGARAVHPGLTATVAVESPLSVDLCMVRSGNRYTLSVTGMDPLRFPDARTLRSLAIRELEKWGLVPQGWDSDQPGLSYPGGPSSLF